MKSRNISRELYKHNFKTSLVHEIKEYIFRDLNKHNFKTSLVHEIKESLERFINITSKLL